MVLKRAKKKTKGMIFRLNNQIKSIFNDRIETLIAPSSQNLGAGRLRRADLESQASDDEGGDYRDDRMVRAGLSSVSDDRQTLFLKLHTFSLFQFYYDYDITWIKYSVISYDSIGLGTFHQKKTIITRVLTVRVKQERESTRLGRVITKRHLSYLTTHLQHTLFPVSVMISSVASAVAVIASGDEEALPILLEAVGTRALRGEGSVFHLPAAVQ